HFGLAFPAYTHFTSPIRRYPDLVVHRGIQALLDAAGAEPKWFPKKALQELGQHCSMTERRADEASREAVNWLKCEFMMDKVGETYTGIITGVTGFGLFVALREIYVEGLIHISTLGEDYFHFDAQHYRIIGDRSKETFQLGDEIEIKVVSVNLDERKMDFERVMPEGQGGGAAKNRRSRRGKKD
ncbi:RNB domain-containing ribonuclease, partial [Acidithiobacillus ferriphilus]